MPDAALARFCSHDLTEGIDRLRIGRSPVVAEPKALSAAALTTSLTIGPDASHWNIVIPRAALADPAVRFGWCKATQGSGFVDPHLAENLAVLKAAADAGQIDWYGAYHWPSTEDVDRQANHFEAVVASFSGDPRFRWTIDVEGGTRFDLDGLAKRFNAKFSPERGLIYGGAFLIGALGNPTPAQAPNAALTAKRGGSIRADYTTNTHLTSIPALYAGKVSYRQYTNGKEGPSPTSKYPRSLPGGWNGDVSAFWAETAKESYEQWLTGTAVVTPPPSEGGFLAMLSDKEQEELKTDVAHIRSVLDGLAAGVKPGPLGPDDPQGPFAQGMEQLQADIAAIKAHLGIA